MELRAVELRAKNCGACGFKAHGRLNVVGRLRRLVEDENGDYIVYTQWASQGK